MEKKCSYEMAKPVINSGFLSTFWDLAQRQDEKRISAAKRMINVIQTYQEKVDTPYLYERYYRFYVIFSLIQCVNAWL